MTGSSLSAFRDYENALLTFTVVTGELQTDPIGNVYPATEELVVRALLKQVQRPIQDFLPGVNPSSVFVRGYVVSVPLPIVGDPLATTLLLPATIDDETPCSAIIGGKSGVFWLEKSVRSPYLTDQLLLSSGLGEAISGYFLAK